MPRFKERKRLIIQLPVGPGGEKEEPILTRRDVFAYIDTLPRKKVAAVCSTARDKKFLQLARDLINPVWESVSTSELCERLAIDLPQLIDRWREHHHAVGMMQLFEALPKFAEELVRDCRTKSAKCPDCQGMWGDPARKCRRCLGEGWIEIPGDPDARDLFCRILRIVPEAQDKLQPVKRPRGRPPKNAQLKPLVRDDISIESMSARLKAAADVRVKTPKFKDHGK